MLIELKGIHKTYDNGQPLHVLKGIDLSIDNGEFVSIMGSSGSGKSTLLNILGILDNYDEGEYHLDGHLIKGLKEREAADYRNRTIGFVFQSFNLIPFKTAVENVELPLFYQGVSRTKRREAAMQLLDKLGLANWAKHYPNEMSAVSEKSTFWVASSGAPVWGRLLLDWKAFRALRLSRPNMPSMPIFGR